jgi:K+-sensing histidine kinase KdpD
LRYGAAILLVGAALMGSQWLENDFASAAVWLLLCAIMLSGWFGGLLPGFLAWALGLLAFDYYFVPPVYSLTPGIWELPRLLLFALVALFVMILSVA